MNWKYITISSALCSTLLLYPLTTQAADTIVQTKIEEPVKVSVQLRNTTDTTVKESTVTIYVLLNGVEKEKDVTEDNTLVTKKLVVPEVKPNSNTVIGTTLDIKTKGEFSIFTIPSASELEVGVSQADVNVESTPFEEITIGEEEKNETNPSSNQSIPARTNIEDTGSTEEVSTEKGEITTIGVPKTGDGSSSQSTFNYWWLSMLGVLTVISGWLLFRKKQESKNEVEFPW